MSEERIDKALEAMKSEAVSAEELAAAKARVWQNLAAGQAAGCAGFRTEFQSYLDGGLAEARRSLLEDHLVRCPECRRAFAELKGERKVVAMPAARRPLIQRWQGWAVAAGVAAVMLYAGRDRVDTLLAPSGPRATVEMASGGLYRLTEGAMQTGAPMKEGEVVRTGPGARAVLRLADGSAVEMNERTELFVSAAWSGQTIHLQRGDVIVQAAKQRRGHLRVQTRDSVASVKGTVFAVSSGMSGSRVSVVEGSVEVAAANQKVLLTRGGQVASTHELSDTPVREAFAWSRNSVEYLTLLGDFAKIEKKLAAISSPALRTQARLLPYIPSDVVAYGAIPNLAGTLKQMQILAGQQALESPAFKQWWTSTAGVQLNETLNRLQSVLPMMGEEIVFFLAGTEAGRIPVVMAEVLTGQQAFLQKELAALPGLAYQVSENLVVVTDTAAHLQAVLAQAGKGAATPFGAEIAKRYQRGTGWLFGVDVAAMPSGKGGQQARNLIDGDQLKYAFVEQRTSKGTEENEATLTFAGPRTGIASWLAEKGTGAAAEYFSSDAIIVFSATTRNSKQLFDELVAKIALTNPKFPEELKALEAKLGISIANDIAAALGTDIAAGLENVSPMQFGWVVAAEVYMPATLDATIAKLVDTFNAELPPDQQNRRITLTQTVQNGITWKTLRSAAVPVEPAWTYDRGYLVMSNSIAQGARAIQTRNGGLNLVHSALFESLLPSTTGVTPSGFLWLNAKGALSALAAQIPNPAIQKLAADRDPILVVLNGETERIRLASRTRFTSLLFNLMMTGSSGGPKTLRQ